MFFNIKKRTFFSLAFGFSLLLLTAANSRTAEAKKPSITFLTKQEAQKEIINDKLEPYFNVLQPMEMSAKTGSPITGKTLKEQRDECRKRYKEGAMEFTDEEKKALEWYIDKLYPALQKQYPMIGSIPWSFLKVSDKIEGGLPHTRDKHIVLASPYCRQLVYISKLNTESKLYAEVLRTLVHEQIHVFQRANPGKFDTLYKELWGFEKAKEIPSNKWLEKHHLANPDAVDCRWILPASDKYLLPLVIFSEGDNPKRMPADIRMVVIPLTKNKDGFHYSQSGEKAPEYDYLRHSEAFRKVFPLSTYVYHPHEASADLFSRLFIYDNYFNNGKTDTDQKKKFEKHLSPLRKWFSNNLRDKEKPKDKQ